MTWKDKRQVYEEAINSKIREDYDLNIFEFRPLTYKERVPEIKSRLFSLVFVAIPEIDLSEDKKDELKKEYDCFCEKINSIIQGEVR